MISRLFGKIRMKSKVNNLFREIRLDQNNYSKLLSQKAILFNSENANIGGIKQIAKLQLKYLQSIKVFFDKSFSKLDDISEYENFLKSIKDSSYSLLNEFISVLEKQIKFCESINFLELKKAYRNELKACVKYKTNIKKLPESIKSEANFLFYSELKINENGEANAKYFNKDIAQVILLLVISSILYNYEIKDYLTEIFLKITIYSTSFNLIISTVSYTIKNIRLKLDKKVYG